MDDVSARDRELVAIGAALGSNCVPCVEYHVPQARRAGVTESQIREAVQIADKVRQVPARKVLDAALTMLDDRRPEPSASRADAACEAATSKVGGGEACCG